MDAALKELFKNKKTAEATGDLIGNKIADKVSSLGKINKNTTELQQKTKNKKFTHYQK